MREYNLLVWHRLASSLQNYITRVIKLIGRPEGKRPLGRPGSRWEDNITILEWILGKYDGKVWTACIWLRD
jgi:hypothetical protein